MADVAPSSLPPSPAAQAFEYKHKLDGTSQRFDLERWLVTPDCFVGRWRADPGNRFGARAGITSWGIWWRTRPYGVYRIHDIDGSLLFYRLDAVKDVRISADHVRYRDLILDARFHPSDRDARKLDVRLEDEDELATALRAGLLSAHDERRIRWTRELFLRHAERISARVDAAIDRAVATVRAGAAS